MLLCRFRLLIFLAVFLPILSACTAPEPPPRARAGVLDLTAWDAQRDGVVPLDGEWAFYWQQLLTPADFRGLRPPEPSGWANLPGTWGQVSVESDRLSGPPSAQGYATYRLRVLLQEQSRLALMVPAASTSYRVWVNGRLVATAGEVGRSAATSEPAYINQVATIHGQHRELDIVMQLGNYHYRVGGTWRSLELGLRAELERLQSRRLAREVALMGGLLLISLYYISYWLGGRRNPAYLCFAILNLAVAVRLLVMGEYPIRLLDPDPNWHLQVKVEFLMFYLALPAAASFMHRLYPDEISRPVTRALWVVSTGVAAATLALPVALASYLVVPYKVLAGVVVAYLLFGLLRATLHRRPDAVPFLAGSVLAVAAAVNDLLCHHRPVLPACDMTPLGLVGLVLVESYVLSRRLSTYQQLAVRDGLTGLFNYAHFHERVAEEARWAERTGRPFAVALVDIDHFKHYNDHNGHPAGNQALIMLARALSAELRASDYAARFGGEEFGLLFRETSLAAARQIAERLLAAVERLPIPGAEYQPLGKFSVSIGVAQYEPGRDSATAVVQRADEALYRAKGSRACVVAHAGSGSAPHGAVAGPDDGPDGDPGGSPGRSPGGGPGKGPATPGPDGPDGAYPDPR